MVDSPTRRKFAEALRQLLSGTIDNIEFDHRNFEDSDDPGVFAIWYSIWLCHDDFHVHPLHLTDGQALDFRRCILFLHSDLDYEWPDRDPWIKRATTGTVNAMKRMIGVAATTDLERLDRGVWPFARRSDYHRALRHPRLLAHEPTQRCD